MTDSLGLWGLAGCDVLDVCCVVGCCVTQGGQAVRRMEQMEPSLPAAHSPFDRRLRLLHVPRGEFLKKLAASLGHSNRSLSLHFGNEIFRTIH